MIYTHFEVYIFFSNVINLLSCHNKMVQRDKKAKFKVHNSGSEKAHLKGLVVLASPDILFPDHLLAMGSYVLSLCW